MILRSSPICAWYTAPMGVTMLNVSQHLCFSPSVDLAEAIDIFGAEVPDTQDAGERFEVDDVASFDNVFPGSASEFSRSGASTEAAIYPRERPRRMADLFGEIMGEAAADRLQKQIAGLMDRVFICASQSAAVNNIALLSSALVSLSAGREAYGPEEATRWLAVSRFSSAILQLCQLVAVSAGRHMAWATMIQRAIWLSHTAVPERERAGLVQGPLALDGLFGSRFSEVLAHKQAFPENRSRIGAILTGSSHQQAAGRLVFITSGSPASKKASL
ncbi:unnamed protein product [Boreogadus saida]